MNLFYRFPALFAFLFLANTMLKAQQPYKPMLSQFNEWHVTNCFFGCLTDVFVTTTDTIVDGYTYAILDGYHFINRNFLLREDTAERQIFMLVTGLGKANGEYLLYDFSLPVGDSIFMRNPAGPMPDSAGYFVVDSIVSRLQFDGDMRRHFYLTASDPSMAMVNNAEWIEGIGSLGLVTTPGTAGDINDVGALSCFFNDLTLRYSNLDSITGCIQEYTNLTVEEHELKTSLNLFPNPASEKVILEVKNQHILRVVLYDLFGRQVWIEENKSQKSSLTLPLLDVPTGCYFITVLTENGQVYQEKLMVE